ncbi:hypothetical protein MSG28_014788 [Choristoneura fumiferana]|uniref:Uncharacterized protein n=1 Tax=Choristoneura fumiferana TaxID=7141 RepID=A0ACC0JT25_CHOFU|nr:hypothetical protein MSG28_014788 [Choristoneura fumiferana]
MLTTVPLACFLSMIRPPGVQFEKALLQVAPVDKSKCPLMRDTNDVEFQLFTRYNPTVYQELVIGDDDKLLASNINFHDPTVIYFHAFMELPDENSGLLVREAYMLRGNSNVIMVDASRLEAGPWYFTAAENTWYIGRFAAKFIDYLVSSHWRSYMYYAESVLRPRSFAAAPCASRAHYERGACAPNYAHMGYAASPDREPSTSECRYTGRSSRASSAPCMPTTHQRHTLSEHDMVRRRSPCGTHARLALAVAPACVMSAPDTHCSLQYSRAPRARCGPSLRHVCP